MQSNSKKFIKEFQKELIDGMHYKYQKINNLLGRKIQHIFIIHHFSKHYNQSLML